MCETMEINTEWRPPDRQKMSARNFSGDRWADKVHTSPSRWQHAFHKSLLSLSSNSPRRQVLIIPILLLRKLKPGEGRWFNKVTQGGPERASNPGTIPWSSAHCWTGGHFSGWGTPRAALGRQSPELQRPSISSWMVHPDSGFESTQEFSLTPL